MKPANPENRVLSEPKKPELKDFGITAEEYKLYRTGERDSSGWGCLLMLLAPVVTFLVIFGITGSLIGNWDTAAGTAVFVCFCSVPPAIYYGIRLNEWYSKKVGQEERERMLGGPRAVKIKQFEEAEATYSKAKDVLREAERARREAERARQQAEYARLRKLTGYWMSLSGIQFEHELGSLYRELGYQVQSTPASGDQGIDLILRKDGDTTIVQCKSYNRPVGPAAARELYGTLTACGAKDAVLACTAGFTQGVFDFVRGKPITLISAQDLALMGAEVRERGPEQSTLTTLLSEKPLCPRNGCGSTMVIRTGRYGRFWGCPKYPSCTGTRQAI